MILALALVAFDLCALAGAGWWVARAARCPHCSEVPDSDELARLLWTLWASCRRCASPYWLWQAVGSPRGRRP